MAQSSSLNISLFQIHMFIIVCECGSFTKAAQTLNLTQSAISKSISTMEQSLGFPLFIRDNKKISLTSSGQILQKEWTHLIHSFNRSVDQAFLMYKREQYSIQIGEPDSMKTDRDYLPQMERFQTRNRDIKLMFTECPIGELVGKLASNELDVIFTIDYEVPALDSLGLNWAPVADSPCLHIILHREHPLCQQERITLEDVRGEEFIVPTPILHQSYIDYILAVCKPYGFKPKISIAVPNARSMISTLLRTKTGVIIGNRFLYDADSPDLRHYEIENTYSRLIVGWKSGSAKPGISEFIRVMTEDYRQKRSDPSSHSIPE